MRKFFVTLICVSCLLVSASAQQPLLKFTFSTGKLYPGYIRVPANAVYNDGLGYGFEAGSQLTAVSGNGPTKNFITSDQPFFFSVKLPEGNYDITVTMGGKNGTTNATVRAECRRMMVPQVRKNGRYTFTVHVRDTLLPGAAGTVRIKPRERNYWHWDNKLTLEFNGTNPMLCAIDIRPVNNAVTVFLAGNSTVVDQAEEPYAAWGQMIPSFFQPGKIAIANYAESGESLSSFLSAKRLEKIIGLMKAGDYLFIEFAHNDQKQKGNGIGPWTSYTRDLKFFIAEARRKGGIPVLVTSMHRRNFDSAGKVVNTLGDYPDAMRQVAKEEKVPLIDLNAMSKTLYEAWGPDKSQQAFVIYPANTFPGQNKALNDNTHFNPYGAYEIARCIAKGILDNKLSIARDLKKEFTDFNPAHPDPIENWYWPLSPRTAVAKPDGN